MFPNERIPVAVVALGLMAMPTSPAVELLPGGGLAMADDAAAIEEVVVVGRRVRRGGRYIRVVLAAAAGRIILPSTNPQGNYCPVGENPDGTCAEPGPGQCPSSPETSLFSSDDCVCPEGQTKYATTLSVPFLGSMEGAFCAPPYKAPKYGLETNEQAVDHYFRGGGKDIEVHDNVKDELKAASVVVQALADLRAGTATQGTKGQQAQLSLNMTESVFYIGNTHVYYWTDCRVGWCTTYFTWGPDYFQDPLDVGIEILGMPYQFPAHRWDKSYADPNGSQDGVPR